MRHSGRILGSSPSKFFRAKRQYSDHSGQGADAVSDGTAALGTQTAICSKMRRLVLTAIPGNASLSQGTTDAWVICVTGVLV